MGRRNRVRLRPDRLLFGAASLLVCVGLSACAATSSDATALRASDFDSVRGESDQLPLDVVAATEPPPALRPTTADSEQGTVTIDTSEPPDDIVVIAGSPRALGDPVSLERRESRPPNQEVFQVDQYVGQVNGRPVFAVELLEPMDARFAREAERLSTEEWIRMARGDISRALFDQVRDQLLLAEFESSLTPEQKMGVLAFIQQVRDDLISGNLGSREEANRRFLEAEGMGLDEKVEDVTERQFIIAQFRKAIGNRVQVSFSEVERYYDAHLDQYMPVPIARFRIIRVPSSDIETLQAVRSHLTDGDDFVDLASRYSTWRPEQGNLHEVVLESRIYTSERFFGPERLDDAARRLNPGHRSEPVAVGSQTYWVMLEEIHQPEGRTLYDVQAEIEGKLREQRVREEESRYLAELFMRGNFSDMEQMVTDLTQFAAERYLIQRRIARPADAAISSER